MPEYTAPTVQDVGEDFPATFSVTLGGNIVVVDFGLQEYQAPANTNVNFDLGGGFEETSVDALFEADIQEQTQIAESASVGIDLDPTVENVSVVEVLNESITTFSYGDSFPVTFGWELAGEEPSGIVFDVEIQEYSDDEQLYGKTLGDAERDVIIQTEGEKDTIILGDADKQRVVIANAEID